MNEIKKSAVLSGDGKYRYVLTRSWGPGRKLHFLMMNPSTADAEVDDATIRKCMGFARRWNYDGIVVVNLFALRSRDPHELTVADDPVGPDNETYIIGMLAAQQEVICAWGCESTMNKIAKDGFTLATRACGIIQKLHRLAPGIRLMCLGHTKGGTPRHPLMLPYSTEAADL